MEFRVRIEDYYRSIIIKTERSECEYQLGDFEITTTETISATKSLQEFFDEVDKRNDTNYWWMNRDGECLFSYNKEKTYLLLTFVFMVMDMI